MRAFPRFFYFFLFNIFFYLSIQLSDQKTVNQKINFRKDFSNGVSMIVIKIALFLYMRLTALTKKVALLLFRCASFKATWLILHSGPFQIIGLVSPRLLGLRSGTYVYNIYLKRFMLYLKYIIINRKV